MAQSTVAGQPIPHDNDPDRPKGIAWTRRCRTQLADGVAIASLVLPAMIWARRLPGAFESNRDVLAASASLAGLVGSWCLMLLLVLAAGPSRLRNLYDNLQAHRRHRWLGAAGIALTGLHLALNVLRLDPHAGAVDMLYGALTSSAYLTATAALATLTANAVSATHLFRGRSPWEPSFKTHQIAALAVVILSLWHEVDAMVAHPTGLLSLWILSHLIAVGTYLAARERWRRISRRRDLRLAGPPKRARSLNGSGCLWEITVTGNNLERLGPEGLEAALGTTSLEIQRADGRWTDPHPLSVRRTLAQGQCRLQLTYMTTSNEDAALIGALKDKAQVRLTGFHGQMTAEHASRPGGNVAVAANGLAIETTLIPLARHLAARKHDVTALARVTSCADLTRTAQAELRRLADSGVRVHLIVGHRAHPPWSGDGHDPNQDIPAGLRDLVRPPRSTDGPTLLDELFPDSRDWDFFAAGNSWVLEIANDLRRGRHSRHLMHLELHAADG